MIGLLNSFQNLLDRSRALDFLGPLLLRAYLVPVFWMAGTQKIKFMDATVENDGWFGWLMPTDATVAWFGNPDWGLGMPMPELMAFLAGWSELAGALLLATGLATRWISIPLMVTMLVAIITVHWQHGWQVIADASAPFANERVLGAADRLAAGRSLLKEHGNYSWLTEKGSFVILNNGIEFAATYLVMLMVLFFIGGGRYLSLDYWIARRYRN
ncbi:MAG: DoxX family protein [Gammaproteobacteria bacterium]